MHSNRAPLATSTNAHPKLPMTQLNTAPMTVPRLSGAARPHTTKMAMTIDDPQKTTGSMLLRVAFMPASRRSSRR